MAGKFKKDRLVLTAGDAVGSFVYIKEAPRVCGKRKVFMRCFCGKAFTTYLQSVFNEHTKSCGCVRGTWLITHGCTDVEGFSNWRAMVERCTKQDATAYNSYGARGITVCAEWLNSPQAFFADMGTRPSPDHSIDRIDGTKGYYKENCRWATRKEQGQNRKTNKLITYLGEAKSLVEWCEILKLNYDLVSDRIRRLKWPAERAFFEPVNIKHSSKNKTETICH